MIRRFSLGVFIIASAIAGTAHGADLASQPAEPVVPLALPYSWTGFYAGVNAGYGFAGNDRVGVRNSGVYTGDIGTLKNSGAFGGAQVGYNYQFGNNIVVGLEADFQGGQIKDTTRGATAGGDGRARSDIQWFGTVRPRLGYAFDRFLVYATGGLAYGHVDYTGSGPAFASPIRDSSTKVGWTAGAGVEYAITDNVTAKFEYQYVSLGGYDVNGLAGLSSTKAGPDFHSVRLGINYKF